MTYIEWIESLGDDCSDISPLLAWTEGHRAGRDAERERIHARAKLAAEKTWKAGDWYVGPQHNMIEKFVDALLEDGDE